MFMLWDHIGTSSLYAELGAAKCCSQNVIGRQGRWTGRSIAGLLVEYLLVF